MSEFDKEYGYTYDQQTGKKRELTETERTELLAQRQKFLERSRIFVEQNDTNYQRFLSGQEGIEGIDITFDDETEYTKFVEWIFKEFGGPTVLGFGLAGIDMNVEVQPWLLRRALKQFKLRPVSISDFERQAHLRVSPYLFDKANIEDRHIPGNGDSRKNSE